MLNNKIVLIFIDTNIYKDFVKRDYKVIDIISEKIYQTNYIYSEILL